MSPSTISPAVEYQPVLYATPSNSIVRSLPGAPMPNVDMARVGPYTDCAATEDAVVVVDRDGRIWTDGNGKSAVLGRVFTRTGFEPITCLAHPMHDNTDTRASMVACTRDRAYVVNASQTAIFTWGAGSPETGYSASPTMMQIPQELRVAEIACGIGHVVVRTANEGYVYGWGWNTGCAIRRAVPPHTSDGPPEYINHPTHIAEFGYTTSVACGDACTVACARSGQLVARGVCGNVGHALFGTRNIVQDAVISPRVVGAASVACGPGSLVCAIQNPETPAHVPAADIVWFAGCPQLKPEDPHVITDRATGMQMMRFDIRHGPLRLCSADPVPYIIDSSGVAWTIRDGRIVQTPFSGQVRKVAAAGTNFVAIGVRLVAEPSPRAVSPMAVEPRTPVHQQQYSEEQYSEEQYSEDQPGSTQSPPPMPSRAEMQRQQRDAVVFRGITLDPEMSSRWNRLPVAIPISKWFIATTGGVGEELLRTARNGMFKIGNVVMELPCALGMAYHVILTRPVGDTIDAGAFYLAKVGDLKQRIIDRAKSMARAAPPRLQCRLVIHSRTDAASIPQVDVGMLQADPANAGAMFQVASNFNAVEAPRERAAPDDPSFTESYYRDRTQGPAASISAAAAAIARVHAVFMNPQNPVSEWAQTRNRQIQMLEHVSKYYTVKNGYVVNTGRESKLPPTPDSAELDYHVTDHVQVAVHLDTEVTFGGYAGSPDGMMTVLRTPRHRINQVCCAAMNIAQDESGKANAADPQGIPKAGVLLRAAYTGTYCAAVAHGCEKLFLTMVGGGAFGNPIPSIFREIINAHRSVALAKTNTTLKTVHLVLFSDPPELGGFMHTLRMERVPYTHIVYTNNVGRATEYTPSQ